MAARCAHWPPSTWVAGEVGTVGTVGAVGVVGVPLDPPEDPPHATLNNASSAIVGFISTPHLSRLIEQ